MIATIAKCVIALALICTSPVLVASLPFVVHAAELQKASHPFKQIAFDSAHSKDDFSSTGLIVSECSFLFGVSEPRMSIGTILPEFYLLSCHSKNSVPDCNFDFFRLICHQCCKMSYAERYFCFATI